MNIPSREIDKDTEWMKQAQCKGQTHLFYEDVQETKVARSKREAEARALCAACPVSAECREYGRRNGEYGIWGDENEIERFLAGHLSDVLIRRRIRKIEENKKRRAREKELLEQL
jgi:WhiB family redox-sensing transcriptional regulator